MPAPLLNEELQRLMEATVVAVVGSNLVLAGGYPDIKQDFPLGRGVQGVVHEDNDAEVCESVATAAAQ